MRWEQERRQRLYSEIAGLIMSWFNDHAINSDETRLLFDLLDEAFVNRNYAGLFPALKNWRAAKTDDELNEIIMATLLAVDFKKPLEIDNLLRTIEELLKEND